MSRDVWGRRAPAGAAKAGGRRWYWPPAPRGRLHVFEHIQAQNPGLARIQHFLDTTIWPTLNGNCHTGPDTRAAIPRAGFTDLDTRDVTGLNHQYRFPSPRTSSAPPVAPAPDLGTAG